MIAVLCEPFRQLPRLVVAFHVGKLGTFSDYQKRTWLLLAVIRGAHSLNSARGQGFRKELPIYLTITLHVIVHTSILMNTNTYIVVYEQ
jgi:hypothetical protein